MLKYVRQLVEHACWCVCTRALATQVGRLLGVPEAFIRRHPFPGPGLAVRVLGDVTIDNKLNILRDADEIFINTIREYGLYDEIWQVGCSHSQSTQCMH